MKHHNYDIDNEQEHYRIQKLESDLKSTLEHANKLEDYITKICLVVKAHDIESLSCDRDGQMYCECLADILEKAYSYVQNKKYINETIARVKSAVDLAMQDAQQDINRLNKKNESIEQHRSS